MLMVSRVSMLTARTNLGQCGQTTVSPRRGESDGNALRVCVCVSRCPMHSTAHTYKGVERKREVRFGIRPRVGWEKSREHERERWKKKMLETKREEQVGRKCEFSLAAFPCHVKLLNDKVTRAKGKRVFYRKTILYWLWNTSESCCW